MGDMFFSALPLVLIAVVVTLIIRWRQTAGEFVVDTSAERFAAIMTSYRLLAGWVFGLSLGFYGAVALWMGKGALASWEFKVGFVILLVAAGVLIVVFVSMSEIHERLLHHQTYSWIRMRLHQVFGYSALVLILVSLILLSFGWLIKGQLDPGSQ